MTDRGVGPSLRTGAIVAIGAIPGATLRSAVAEAVATPVGTLAVNVLACFLLGLVVYAARYRGSLARRTNLLVTTGFCGSLSTYSTFAFETATRSSPALAIGYVGATYALGFGAVLCAGLLARKYYGAAGASFGGASA